MNIHIKQLTKYYEGKCILEIDELRFKRNKTTCIRGRNGTGKTTLLKIIANILPCDTGTILYDEQMMHKKIMKNMTYVSQNPYIFNTTVYNNIVYPLRLRNSHAINEQLVEELMVYFEIDQLKHQQAKACSSGEKMKIAILRALIFKPDLLLLDEPTTNLDIESIEKLKDTLLKIKDQTTIIFISHNIDFINQISDYEYVLKDTKIEKSE